METIDPRVNLLTNWGKFSVYCSFTYICASMENLAGHGFVSVNIQPCLYIQANLIIMLSLGSKETDRVISELCYNEVIYN